MNGREARSDAQGPGRWAELMERVRASGADQVQLQFTDIPGGLKSVVIPARQLPSALEGVWFDGSAVEGLARVAERDLYLRPDTSTLMVTPWEARPTARLLCDIEVPEGAQFAADPRGALRRVLDELAQRGLEYRVASEVEFFLFAEAAIQNGHGDQPRPADASGYFEASGDVASRVVRETVEALEASGIVVESTHHEVAPGQYEIDLSETDALSAADALVTLKWALRALARRAGLTASFMPKPIEGASGSGLHLAQLLRDARGGTDLFQAPDRPYGLSEGGGSFIAGQLARARGICAVVAPLVNSYKRLCGGSEAPARVCWARSSRAALIRVPEVSRSSGTRLEFRAADPSCNPYLALSVLAAAGLEGMDARLTPPDPADRPDGSSELAEEGLDPLPRTLGEALEELEWSDTARSALGQPIYERFLTAKEQEWSAFERHISRWELEAYLHSA